MFLLETGGVGFSKGDKKVLKRIKTPAHEDGDTNQEITFLFNICFLLKTCLELSYLYFMLLSVCFPLFVGKTSRKVNLFFVYPKSIQERIEMI